MLLAAPVVGQADDHTSARPSHPAEWEGDPVLLEDNRVGFVTEDSGPSSNPPGDSGGSNGSGNGGSNGSGDGGSGGG